MKNLILISFLAFGTANAATVYTVLHQDKEVDGSYNLTVIFDDKKNEKETVIIRLSAKDASDKSKVSSAVDARITEWKTARSLKLTPVPTPQVITITK